MKRGTNRVSVYVKGTVAVLTTVPFLDSCIGQKRPHCDCQGFRLLRSWPNWFYWNQALRDFV